MKTVVVIEGFAGGPMHTRHFRRALKEAGFKVIRSKHRAAIIVAHSAGIYAIPAETDARLLMLIGPTYWPGEPLLKRLVRHNRSGRRYLVPKFGWRFYIWTKVLEFYYFFRRHIYMWYGIYHNNRLNHLHRLAAEAGRKVLVIRNHEDPFTSPEIKAKLSGKNVKYVELPGIHEDYVTNPKPYIDLLLKNI